VGIPSLRLLLHHLLSVRRAVPRQRRPGRPAGRKGAARPFTLEQLEARCLPSTLQAISLPAANQPPSDSAAGVSDSASVSADGRYVAFESKAPNLVAGQTGPQGAENVYLLDRNTNLATLVSHAPGSSTATPASGMPSFNPVVSNDGRFVLYQTEAAEFAPGLMTDPLTGTPPVVVLYDRQTGINTLVSHSSTSLTAPAVSDFGGSARSDPVAITADGRYVLFASDGINLVPGQVAGSGTALFLYDRTTGATQLVSHLSGQDNAPQPFSGQASIADDGTVAWVSSSQGPTGQADAYLYSPTTHANQLVSAVAGSPAAGAGGVLGAVISADASTVAFVTSAGNLVAGQSSTTADNVYRYVRSSGTTTLVSGAGGSATTGGNADSGGIHPNVTSGGAAGVSLVASRDGRFLAFTSDATNLVPGQTGPASNAFLFDAQSPGLTLLSAVTGSTTAAAGGVPDLLAGFGFPGDDPITGYGILGGPRVLSISGDGSLVAYVSSAGNIVPGQSGPPGVNNVFLYSGGTRRSALATGVGGSATATPNYESVLPVLSGDGSVLTFTSLAPDLSPGRFDGNGVADVFAYVPAAANASLVSRAAFPDPEAPGNSYSTSVSADGRYTVFTSNATNLVPNQVTVNTQQNVFLFDKQTGVVTLVNHAPGTPNTTGDHGVTDFFPAADNFMRPPDYQQPVISADGSTIAFASFDDNLVPGETRVVGGGDSGGGELLYLYDVATGQITLVNHAPGQPATIQARYNSFQPAISADGNFVAYGFGDLPPNAPLGVAGIALYDRRQDTITLITGLTDTFLGMARDPVISDDGRFVAYEDFNPGNSFALTVILYDRGTGTAKYVSHAAGSPTTPANGTATGAVISHDGSHVGFVSTATDLVSGQSSSGAPGLTNVFLYNVATGTVSLVSGAAGAPTSAGGNGNSDSPAIDADGSYVAYRSDATNLVTGQTGSPGNILEFNARTGAQTLVSHQAGAPTAGAGGAAAPVFDANGRRMTPVSPVLDDDGHLVSYSSTAADLIPGQGGTAGVKNVFVWLRQTGANILASGQGGSPTVGGDQDSDGPLLTRDSFPSFSSRGKLLPGLGGASVAYINTLVDVSLSANTIAGDSPAGTLVGNLTVSSLLAGQYLPPTYSLPPGAGNNVLFVLGGTAGGAAPLLTGFQAGFAGQQAYQIVVVVNVGFGDDPILLEAFGPAPAPATPPPPGRDPVAARLVSVRVGKKKTTRLMIEVFDAVSGAVERVFLSPFQKPAYSNIRVSAAGNQVVLTARHGKKKVTRTFTA
jgi:Tol biopolymer transport system component